MTSPNPPGDRSLFTQQAIPRLLLGVALTLALVALLLWWTPLGLLAVVGVGLVLTYRLSVGPQQPELHWEPQQILEAIPVQIWLLDKKGRLVAQNRSARQGAIQRVMPCLEAASTEQSGNASLLPECAAETQEVLRTGQAIADRLQKVVTPEGQEKWLSISKVPITRELQIVGVVFTLLDRTLEIQTQQSLREREAEARRLALVAQHTDNLVVITDAQGYIEWVNDAFTRLSGWTLEDCRGRKPGHLLQGPNTDRKTVEYMSRCIQRGQGFHVEILNYHRCGRPYWLDLNVQPVRDAQGKLTNFISIERDITEKKRSEEELRQRVTLATLSAEVNAALTTASSQAAMLQRCAEALVKHLDATLARIWTLSPHGSELELQASAGLYTHLDGPEARLAVGQNEIGKIAASRLPILSNDLLHDSRLAAHDWAKQQGIVSFAGHPLLVEGRLVGVMALFSRKPLTGVTLSALAGVADAMALGLERKRIEIERDQLFLLSPDPIVIADYQGICRNVNPAYERLTGFCQAESQGASLMERVVEEDKATLVEAMQRLHSDSQPVTCEFRKITRSGEVIWTSWAAIRAEGQNVIYCIGRDITASKRHAEELARAKEQAEAANLAKSAFLSRMSHELRTPLNAILGFAQLMEITSLSEGQRESIEQILKGGRHLLRLINDVLDLSRVESGNLALELAPLELAQAIQETIDMIRSLAVSRQIQIELEPCSGSAWVLADRRRFVQALLNLLSNAVKYNREQGRVWIRSRLGNVGWRVEVQDEGPGLRPEQIALLFRPFERLGAERSSTEGTGLGLALARTLIEAMNGRIGADCQPGQGCTFWIELPASPVLSIGPSIRPGSYQGVKPWQGGGTILQIEDNPTNSQLVELILTQRPNLTLVNASTGQEGLDRAERCLPSLILLDVQLPDMDGYQVLQRLKANSTTATIPVIVLSADATLPTIEQLRAAGAVAYLTKPLDVHRLLAVVDTYLQTPQADSHG